MALRAHEPALDSRADAGLKRVALDAREQLGEQRLVDPVDAIAMCLRAADEVEQVDDAGRLMPRVLDERVRIEQPAHGDLFAVALDGFARDRSALLGDVVERLEEHAPLRPAARDAARLVGARERIEHGLDHRHSLRVLGDRVDATQQSDEMEERLRDDGRAHVRSDELLGRCAEAPLIAGDHVVLLDGGIDALLEDGRRLFLRERDDGLHEVGARHRLRADGDELIE